MTMTLFPCAHCEKPCSGVIALQVHLCNSNVNVLCGAHYFCSAECRDTWYETPTEADVVPVLRAADATLNLHAGSGPLDVLVLHHDGDDGAVVHVTPHGHLTPSPIAGSPRERHVMTSPDHVLAWWRGEVESIPVPFPEEPTQ